MEELKPVKSVRFKLESESEKELQRYAIKKSGNNFSGFVKRLIEGDRVSGGLLYQLADEVLAEQLRELLSNGGSIHLHTYEKEDEEVEQLDEATLKSFY